MWRRRSPLSIKVTNLMVLEDEYVVVVPGARWIVKEWPLLNFGELCIRLCESGKKVVIAGAPDDAEKELS